MQGSAIFQILELWISWQAKRYFISFHLFIYWSLYCIGPTGVYGKSYKNLLLEIQYDSIKTPFT